MKLLHKAKTNRKNYLFEIKSNVTKRRVQNAVIISFSHSMKPYLTHKGLLQEPNMRIFPCIKFTLPRFPKCFFRPQFRMFWAEKVQVWSFKKTNFEKGWNRNCSSLCSFLLFLWVWTVGFYIFGAVLTCFWRGIF